MEPPARTRHNTPYSSSNPSRRSIQQTLAKQKEYAEAHKIKLKADNLEAFELEKMRNQHQVHIPSSLLLSSLE